MSAEVTVNDLSDGLHPNDHGYSLMAQVWYGGIQAAASKGWINPPVASAVDDGTCVGSLYWDPVYGTIASGIGSGDIAFQAGWNPVGKLAGGIGAGAGVSQYLIACIDSEFTC
jgi:hypothetical protein